MDDRNDTGAADAELIERYRAGDDHAFALLHARHAAAVVGHLRRHGVSDGVDDIVQETFASAARFWRRSSRPIATRPWLFAVARNHVIDDIRRRGNRADVGDVWDLQRPAQWGNPVHAFEIRESLSMLLAAIAALPPRQRDALILHAVAGMSHAQIATALGINSRASASAVERARRALARRRPTLVTT